MLKQSKTIILAALTLINTILVSACNESHTIVRNNDDTEILYKFGELTFIGEHTDEIYSDKYSRDYYDMYPYLAITSDSVLYGNYEPILLSDDGSMLELCRDPLCDHSKPQTCILSYGGVRRIIYTDDYIYFAKSTGVYRYDLNTLTSEPYAIFNAYVYSQFLMGRYLYIDLGAGDFIKVNIETDEAVIITDIPITSTFNCPCNGYIYSVDSAGGIYRCDDNFENIEQLTGERIFGCDIPASYQIYGDYIYYPIGKTLYRKRLDDLTGEAFLDNIYAFTIADDTIYYEIYHPQPGPAYDNGSEIVTRTLHTGNNIYSGPLDSPQNGTV